jgi:N-acyl-D-amino-acid deacylase
MQANHEQGPGRRALVAGLAAALGLQALARAQGKGAPGGREPESSPASIPSTGEARPQFASYDRMMLALMAEHGVPGASLAVARDGKLLLARGYGWADIEKREPVQPESMFRIASLTKPLTAALVLRLAEQGEFRLDDAILERLPRALLPKKGAFLDPRLARATIRHCLQHTAGWDRGMVGDPIAIPREIAKDLRIEGPPAPRDIVRWQLAQPLQFEPGARHAYSNVGYLVLARIVEEATGKPFARALDEQILSPLRMARTRLGGATLEKRVKGEVRYYDGEGREAPNLYETKRPSQVPVQYGGEHLEGFEAHGGLISSAIDLVRFASSFDDPRASPILGFDSIRELCAPPAGEPGHDAQGKRRDAYYGCGMLVRPLGEVGRANLWHSGLIAGSESFMAHLGNRLNWCVLFNTNGNAKDGWLAGQVDGRLHEATSGVQDWEAADLHPRYAR